MPRITKETTLAEILKRPKTKEVLKKFNVPCLACPFAKFEMEKLKIGEICNMYNIDLQSLLTELNKVKVEKRRKPL
jgi:hybrid cluster-associated redox disulfide protein